MTISREAQSIIDYVESCGVPYRVTDVSGPGHAPNSYHYAEGTGGTGLAVDFGGVTPGITPVTTVQMTDIYRALRDVAPQLAELIHNGPGTGQAVRNGRLMNGPSLYGPVVWAAHKNHVHVAVRPGVFLAPLKPLVAESHTEVVPIPVHDYEEAATKTTRMIIGPLDKDGNGWSTWDPGFARDPVIVAVTLHGPSPADDGYWPQQSSVTLAAQPRGGKLLVTVRKGTAGDTVTAWVSVA